MKKSIKPEWSNKNLKKGLSAMAAILLINLSSFAQALDSTVKAPTVAFVGTTENLLTFQVQLDNPASEKVTVTIKGNNGEMLYHAFFRDIKLDKKFQFYSNELEENKLTFILTTAKNAHVQEFEINKKIVENYIVTKTK